MLLLCYPETKGHILEEMARIFDGDNAAALTIGEISAHLEAKRDVSGKGCKTLAVGSWIEE